MEGVRVGIILNGPPNLVHNTAKKKYRSPRSIQRIGLFFLLFCLGFVCLFVFETCFVDQAGLELIEFLPLPPQVLGLQVCIVTLLLYKQ